MPANRNLIKYFREQRNMTQQELADRMRVTVRSLRRWENGEACMDVYNAIKLSAILGVKIEEIFGF